MYIYIYYIYILYIHISLSLYIYIFMYMYIQCGTPFVQQQKDNIYIPVANVCFSLQLRL